MHQQNQRALAAEVLEMGEQLFALALQGQVSQQTPVDEEETEPSFPLAEIEAASSEFFTALRLLLGMEQV
jgi:hypothetical protein